MEKEKKSNVWSYFDLDEEKKKTKCRLCGVSLSYAGSTTSSMKKHLSCKHRHVDNDTVKCKQATIETFGNFGVKKPVDRKWYEKVTQKAMLMCVRDLRPLNIVQGEGFRSFCAELNPNYKVPCSTTLHNYLHKTFNEAKADLKLKLQTIPHIALTTDMWTSIATEGYITITAHFLNNWVLDSCVLATRKVEDRHTGENIGNILKSVQEEFGIVKVTGITTDNASNMSLAAKAAGYPHVRCFAHTLQLAVHDGLKLPSIENMLMFARKLVAFFSKSTMATQQLREHQSKLGKMPKNVITDVVTRWNSAYFMLERLAELHTDIVAVLHDPLLKKHKILNLKDNHWSLLEYLVVALKPLVSATEVLCSEEFPTSSGVYPLLFALVNKHLKVSDLDTNIIAEMKTSIAKGLQGRLLKDEYWKTPQMIVTALDPCYKNLKFLSHDQKKDIENHIIDLIDERNKPDVSDETDDNAGVHVKEEQESPEITPSSHQSNKRFKFCENDSAVSFLLDDIIEISDDDSFKKDARTEYHDFLSAPNKLSGSTTLKSFTLGWWRENANLFPRIASLAKEHLCIPGTSVPSERAFSTAGLTITKQRLVSSTADAIIFLNKNLRNTLQMLPGSAPPAATSTSSSQPVSAMVKTEPADTTPQQLESSEDDIKTQTLLPDLPVLDTN